MEDRSATYIGTFVDCPNLGELRLLRNYELIVDSAGFIKSFKPFVESEVSNPTPRNVTNLQQGSFFLPTFCDLHFHAPQFLYQGTGLHLPLMKWLEEYAFKAEERIDSDAELAKRVYGRLAERLKENGTGAVLLFGTIKSETNLLLAKIMQESNIRAFVGKLSMDISPRPTYTEHDANTSITAATQFVQSFQDSFAHLSPQARLVEPVITPRFVPSCSNELLRDLGELAEVTAVRIQSHLAEARDQVDWVRKERGVEDVEVFQRSNLLTHHCVQAHCTYLTSTELAQLARSGTSIAHCPLSNAYFSAKPFPLREALDVHLHGISGKDATNPDGPKLKVGLGTDIAGGYSADIMNAMRSAVMVSRMREGQRIEDEVAAKEAVETESVARTQSDGTTTKQQLGTRGLSIDWKESLYLATRGGALALGLHAGSGSFVVGAPFDAQQIEIFDTETSRGVGALDFFDAECGGEFEIGEQAVEKWWCVGDVRNRRAMWVQGRKC